MRFFFLTKTVWNEPPRIRHQLARLLSNAGYEVVFFEKPSYPYSIQKYSPTSAGAILLDRHAELIHHKLQITKLLYYINSEYVKRQLKNVQRKHNIKNSDIIINFHYNYGFLRDVFKHQKIITVFNDNFHSRALFGYQKPLINAIEKTCRASNTVLAVSKPLIGFLSAFCEPDLFLPWPQTEYQPPKVKNCDKKVFLFWGYINYRLDWDLIYKYAEALLNTNSELEFLFVGPVENEALIKRIKTLPNVRFQKTTPLQSLPLENVLAAIIPYKNNIPAIEAINFSNKAFQLISFGLPLLISGMPNFLQKPFIFRMTDSPNKDVLKLRDCFPKVQSDIKKHLNQNSAEKRLEQLFSYIS